MRDETIARNYAEALFSLAERHEGFEVFGKGIEGVARLIDENDEFRMFLATPRIAAGDKKALIRKVFSADLPKMLLNFLLICIDKRRQRLFEQIASEFHSLVDEHLGRVHVEVTVAREVDEATLAGLTDRLGVLLGKKAVPHVRVKPELLGGVVIRTGDTIYDGSLRRRLSDMRQRLLAVDMPG